MKTIANNPFPGMNPWLESFWRDMHTRLTTYASDFLQPLLPDGLVASVEEYLAIESQDDDSDLPVRTRFAPDVRVFEQQNASMQGSVAVLDPIEADGLTEPIIFQRTLDPETLRFIQILDTRDNERIITSIEFLSPANKTTTAGRKRYLTKQQSMIEAKVNLVEIDLVRTGAWVMAVQKSVLPVRFREPYRICVVRASSSDEAEVYQASFHTPLPSIRIPLRKADADVRLPLQQIIETAFTNGVYGSRIDYDKDPVPPLSPHEAEWISQWFAKAHAALAGQ